MALYRAQTLFHRCLGPWPSQSIILDTPSIALATRAPDRLARCMAGGGSNAVVVNEEHQVMTCAGSTARAEETTYGLKAIAALSVMY